MNRMTNPQRLTWMSVAAARRGVAGRLCRTSDGAQDRAAAARRRPGRRLSRPRPRRHPWRLPNRRQPHGFRPAKGNGWPWLPPSCWKWATRNRPWSRSSAPSRPTRPTGWRRACSSRCRPTRKRLFGQREYFTYRVEPGESLSRIAGRFLKDVHLFYAGALQRHQGAAPACREGRPSRYRAKPPVAPRARRRACGRPGPAARWPRPPPGGIGHGLLNLTPEALAAQEYRRGLSLMAQQKPAEAVRAFDKVLEVDANHANAKIKRAQAVSQVGGLIRLLDNNIKRLDGAAAQSPGNAALKTERATRPWPTASGC